MCWRRASAPPSSINAFISPAKDAGAMVGCKVDPLISATMSRIVDFAESGSRSLTKQLV
jgi:hypothetical protein